MLNMMNNPTLLVSPEKAEEIAAELNSSDPDWTYKAKHDPTGKGYSFIEIYDEDGEYVGKWQAY